MVYLDNEFAKVAWDEADQIVVVEWRSYADGSDYRNVCNAIVELIWLRSGTKILADTRKSKAVTPEDQDWVITVWVPRARMAGVKHIATLVPESTVGKLSLDRMRAKYAFNPGGGSLPFTEIEEARAWLRKAPR